MLKNISNFGKILSKNEQKSVRGSGAWGIDACDYWCDHQGVGQGVLKPETACGCGDDV
ncbi:hypothetical protein [Aquimarina aggregata]|uniref:hypothetical protein n=1 Tax=Aquimarina aggregata TaxID=1642818 RepID=UPI00248FFA87|nr:hypothetical protein [Aquimarina aggregata]